MMSWIVFLVVVSLTNVPLGFLAALYMGRGPRDIHELRRAVRWRPLRLPLGWRLPFRKGSARPTPYQGD